MIYKLNKWNYKTHSYISEIIKGDYLFSLYETDMEKRVNCPHCKKEIRYGESYVSLEYHNEIGIGMAVCEKCYNEEWKRRKHYEQMGDSK